MSEDEDISDEEWIIWQEGMMEALTRERDEARKLVAQLEEQLAASRCRDEEARALLVQLSRSILGSREEDEGISDE